MATVATAAALGWAWTATPDDALLKRVSTWQRMANPGDLSKPHADLEADCGACHVPVTGPSRDSCVLCHANETVLLQRQPTAFHSSISECTGCHPEHRGARAIPTSMDHGALARIGLDELEQSSMSQSTKLSSWILAAAEAGERQLPSHPAGVAAPTARERLLDCFACHSREDRHLGLMGTDCVACHGTESWTLDVYRHPSPQSRDCAHCHQAPPSHYMGHFNMVSAKVARKPHADVGQCFECHRSTAWTDIPGVGYYKHH